LDIRHIYSNDLKSGCALLYLRVALLNYELIPVFASGHPGQPCVRGVESRRYRGAKQVAGDFWLIRVDS
jgi:hypothetical protein